MQKQMTMTKTCSSVSLAVNDFLKKHLLHPCCLHIMLTVSGKSLSSHAQVLKGRGAGGGRAGEPMLCGDRHGAARKEESGQRMGETLLTGDTGLSALGANKAA